MSVDVVWKELRGGGEPLPEASRICCWRSKSVRNGEMAEDAFPDPRFVVCRALLLLRNHQSRIAPTTTASAAKTPPTIGPIGVEGLLEDSTSVAALSPVAGGEDADVLLDEGSVDEEVLCVDEAGAVVITVTHGGGPVAVTQGGGPPVQPLGGPCLASS